MDRGEIVRTESLHQVVAGQELVGGEDAVGVLARDAHEAGQAGAGADEHGLEAFLVHQGVDGDGPADDHVQFDLDAEGLDGLDLGGHDLVLRKTELGDAVLEHAARTVQRLEDGHVIAELRKVRGAGQAGRAGADDRHFLAVGGSDGGGRGLALLARPVGHEALELADRDALALDAQDAAAFALGLLRAHTAANGRQRAVLGDDRRGAGEIAVLDLRDEFGNLDAYGAGAHAAGVLAMQAAGGLKHRLIDIVSVADLFEIGRPHFRVLFPDGNSSNLVRHSH